MGTATSWRLAAVFGVLLLVIAAGVVFSGATRRSGPAAGAVAVTAGSDRCSGWDAPHPGPVMFRVTNTANQSLDIYLQDPRTGRVFGEVEGIGTAARADLRVVLGNGRYRFVCLAEEEPPVDGAVFVVTGGAHDLDATPGVIPVTYNDLAQPVAEYTSWVTGQFPAVRAAVEQLRTAVDSGSVPDARGAWLTAHLAYTRLGGAYGDFGDSASRVDDDFAALEQDLWAGGMPASAPSTVDDLAAAIAAIQHDFDPTRFNRLDIGLRAHEILEDQAQQELNGERDAISGSSLATIDAGIAATRAAIDPLRPLLAVRGYRLADADAALTALATAVDGYRGGDGTWTALATLDAGQRQRLDALMAQTLEVLAPIAAITDIRRGADS